MKKMFIAILACITALLSGQQYELSICAIFRDDAKYIPEWIDFHRKQGVDHFYLFDNLSNDNPKHILRKYIKGGSVTLIDWPFESTCESDWGPIQHSAYMHCINHYGRKSKWIAFLDTDEFLFSPTKRDLRLILTHFKSHPGVGVNWIMYGSSNVLRIENGEKMVDKLVWRGPINQGVNTHIKSIVQPRMVIDCISPHYFIFSVGSTVSENLKPIAQACTDSVSVDLLRINHYWQRDLEFFMNVKVPRRLKWGATVDQLMYWKDLYNDVYDPILRDWDL